MKKLVILCLFSLSLTLTATLTFGCVSDPDCGDGVWCNGYEYCIDPLCYAGPSPCDDDDECTLDLCTEPANYGRGTCDYLCNSGNLTGPEDPCCSNPLCSTEPYCQDVEDAYECEGNFDCDQDVDGADAITFKTNFGRNPSWYFNPCTGLNPCPGDFDCDQDVDGTDATVFKEDFGRSLLGNSCPACKVGDYCYVKTCKNNTDCDITYYCEKPVGKCDSHGACSVIPSGCPDIFIPICGCDGNNYGNDCKIKWEGESIDHYGWCTE